VVTVKSQLGEDGQIEISVNDTGPGLPQGKADQIFDAFFTTKPQGSGMGLAILEQIQCSHPGSLSPSIPTVSEFCARTLLPPRQSRENSRLD
jgi:signal transduction histidine kinase